MRYRRREERGEDKYENAVDFTGSYCNCPDRDLDCASVGKKIALYAILIGIALIMLLPFYMMFVMSTLKTNEIYSFPPIVTFGSNLLANFASMNKQVDLIRAFLNSCIVTFSYTILVLFFCSIGGYAFSVYDFPGKKVLFINFAWHNDDSGNSRYDSVVHHDESSGLGQ